MAALELSTLLSSDGKEANSVVEQRGMRDSLRPNHTVTEGCDA